MKRASRKTTKIHGDLIGELMTSAVADIDALALQEKLAGWANHLGFTGSRNGLTVKQRIMVSDFLKNNNNQFNVLHHGCCIGADYRAAKIAKNLGYVIIGHPPIDVTFQMDELYLNDILRKPKPYLERDWDIVNNSSFLLATPSTKQASPRSGTWTTIRYAREAKIPYLIIHRDGTTYDG